MQLQRLVNEFVMVYEIYCKLRVNLGKNILSNGVCKVFEYSSVGYVWKKSRILNLGEHVISIDGSLESEMEARVKQRT